MMSTSSHSDASNRRGLASHTLIVLSALPETMVLPSGEKATDITTQYHDEPLELGHASLLCALCSVPCAALSAFSSRDATTSTGGAVKSGRKD